MPLLSYDRLVNEVVEQGVLEGLPHLGNVNGSSIDITLGPDLLIEDLPYLTCPRCGRKRLPRSVLAFQEQMSRENRNNHIYCGKGEEDDKCGYGGPFYEWIEPVDFGKKEPIRSHTASCVGGYVLWPGEVCLAHTVEIFNLPSHLTAEYRLKSSMARVFLEHLHAGWCDPGWHGSQLTLEFVNTTQFHPLLLTAGMKCGQVCFYDHEPVPEEYSYSKRGQYNHQRGATASKGMR